MANEQYANGNNEQYGTVATGGSELPAGVILMWSGAVASIPTGYAFCNGQNGTPDLRDRFVVCAQTDNGGVAKADPEGSGLKQSGGEEAHMHGFATDGHSHTITQEASVYSGSVNALGTLETEDGWDVGWTDAMSNAPTYYALAYIMKL